MKNRISKNFHVPEKQPIQHENGVLAGKGPYGGGLGPRTPAMG